MESAQRGEFDNRSCVRGRADKPRSFVVGGYALTDALVWASQNEEPRAVFERHRFAKLQGGPWVRRVSSSVGVNDLTAVETYDEEREDRCESEFIPLQEVAGPDLILMILREGPPCLAATTIWPDAPNVSLDHSFADSEPKLEELPSNSLAAPSRLSEAL